MTFLALVRHGQTEWNRERRIQGLTDIPLNDQGREDARRAAEALSSESFDGVVTSPLVRAQETASIIAAELGLPDPVVNARIHERHFGDAEGILVEDYLTKFGGWDAAAHGGEDLDAVRDRALDALMVLSREARERLAPAAPSYIVVTHGGVIRSLLHHASGGTVPAPGDRLSNGSVHRFVAERDALRLLAYESV